MTKEELETIFREHLTNPDKPELAPLYAQAAKEMVWDFENAGQLEEVLKMTPEEAIAASEEFWKLEEL